MRLLAAFARWAAYAVGWFAGWGALGVVLTWRSFRKHPRTDFLVRSTSA